jgi:hypothetical protein
MGLLIIAIFFVGFIAWALLSGRFTKGRVTKEPKTLHTEPGNRPDQNGPIRDMAATTETQTSPTDGNVHNMP